MKCLSRINLMQTPEEMNGRALVSLPAEEFAEAGGVAAAEFERLAGEKAEAAAGAGVWVDFGDVGKVYDGAFVDADELGGVETGFEIAEGGVQEKAAVGSGGKDEFVFGE